MPRIAGVWATEPSPSYKPFRTKQLDTFLGVGKHYPVGLLK